ncbi:hypothetical protein AB0L63_07075 [Nocardia sp. NPDC051990]|uniref:hypothetical protein n=1 Tax=Nocardia sp. NPDC051990 TaxID=3155285 RepID=UPI00343CFE8B
MSDAVDQSVLDLLRQSAVGPMLARPVNDVLKDMGLPQLPDLAGLPPLPDLPPLPVIDLSLLAKPLTDLAATFGTGQFPVPAAIPAENAGADPENPIPAAAPVVDPTQVLSQISSVVQTVVQLGSTALQMAMQLWQSQAADKAADKGTQAQKDGTNVAAQGAETSLGVANAAGTVFRGSAMMSAIIAKFMASLTASAPFLATPGGQAFVLAMSAETLAEATAVVAETRGELTVHSAEMAKTGTKVPITDAPKGVDPMQMVSQLMQMVGPLASAATTGAQSIAQAHAALNPVKPASELDRDKLDPQKFSAAGGGGAPIGMGGGGGMGAVATPARPLSPWVDTRGAGALGAAGATGTSSAGSGSGGSSAAARGSATTSSPGMMPMGAAGAGAGMARSGEESADGLRGQLVTAQHGNEVVGDIEGVSLPVVGAAERVSDHLDDEPPDQALTL